MQNKIYFKIYLNFFLYKFKSYLFLIIVFYIVRSTLLDNFYITFEYKYSSQYIAIPK